MNDALLIHDALTALGAHITTRCYGYTASAATIIAQAASPGCREISANALYLIHGRLRHRRQRRRAERQTRPAAPDRRAHRRSLCRPFGTPGGRVRNPDGRKQRQRPLAVARRDRRGRSGRRRDRCGGASRPSLTRNIARGWERLLIRIGLSAGEQLPADRDRNVLHTEGEERELLRRSAAAVRQAQQRVVPTQTRPREDPSYGDLVRTANQRAYSEDAKRLRNM